MRFLRLAGAYLMAVLVAAAAGTVIQTQCNLAAIDALGAPVPLAVRLNVSLRDLIGFGPAFAGIVAIGFLVAFPVAALLGRRWPVNPMALYALAGAMAIITALLAMEAVFGLTAIAAARGPGGLGLLALAGAGGGWAFGRMRVQAKAGLPLRRSMT